MRVMVTGSEGNVGTRLVPALKGRGHEVTRLDIEQRYGHDYVLCDICRPGELWRAAQAVRPEVVFHLAAMVSRVTCERSPEMCVDTNLSGLHNVAQTCIATGARLVYLSTSEVYGNIGGVLSEDRTDLAPNNLYGLTKLMGETLVSYLSSCGLDAVTVRPFMLYDETETFGDNRSAMIRFAEAAVRGRSFTVHRGTSRSWLHMLDAVEILALAGEDRDAPRLLNMGHPDVVAIESLAKMVCRCAGVRYEDLAVESPQPPRMTSAKRPSLGRQEALMGGWPRIPLEQGVERVVDEVRRRVTA